MSTETTAVRIEGECAAGFQPVRRAFEENFAERGEIGAAVSVTVRGETVVDLWAGWADPARTRPWRADTLTNVWSTTKGMTAICAHQLADRGELDLDAPVAKYWPEFAAAGKQDIPVRWLLSHRSGLTGIGLDHPTTVEDLYDWDKITGLLAAQEPLFEPGSASGYHALSFGFLVGEVIRRISGRTVGEFFADYVAAPLDADFRIGGVTDLGRCSTLRNPALTPEGQSAMAEAMLAAGPVAIAAIANPALTGDHANVPAWREAELPALNGHGTARAIATIYGALADGSERLLSAGALATATASQGRGIDLVGRVGAEWSLGFCLGSDERSFGPNPHAFGHDGFGGSTGGADPAAGIAFGYTMNNMGPQLRDDPRKMALVEAIFRSDAS